MLSVPGERTISDRPAGGACETCTPISTTVVGSYIPIDAGLRAGLGFSHFRPYLGIFFNDSVVASTSYDGTQSQLNASQVAVLQASNFAGLGGDAGLDYVARFLRFGLELRALWNLTSVYGGTRCTCASPDTGAELATILQALLSARVSF